jgi:hypothetical protein
MRFDTKQAAQMLDDDCGLEFHRQMSHDQAKAANALEGHATLFLRIALLCICDNRIPEAREFLNRAYAWLTEAIEIEEKPNRYFPFATEAGNYQEANLIYWLLHGKDSPEHLDQSVAFLDRYFASKPKMTLRTLAMYFPAYLNARRYQRVLDLLAGHKKWVPPTTEKRRWSEMYAAYYLAASRVHGEPSAEALERGLHAFLARELNTWLLDGLYSGAARWIKIIRWNDVPDALEPIALIHSHFAAW